MVKWFNKKNRLKRTIRSRTGHCFLIPVNAARGSISACCQRIYCNLYHGLIKRRNTDSR